MSIVTPTGAAQPVQPSYVLRGHKSQVHALLFLRGNTRLLSGDASGIIILWDTAAKRSKAVWKAHDGGVLGLETWGIERILSHGRDGRVKVWQLRESDESRLSTLLPVKELGEAQSQWKDPWMLHSLRVYTLNFCAFAVCKGEDDSVLIATPAANEGATAIHSLPSEDLVELVLPAQEGKTGMVMALKLTLIHEALHLITGYESGATSVQKLNPQEINKQRWETISTCKPHSQPILSLDFCIREGVYFTSGADAVIAKGSLSSSKNTIAINISATKHSGQQSLVVRSDGKIFATSGWDGKIRVYSVMSLKEVAVLKWHTEGCYAAAFAQIQYAGTNASHCGAATAATTEIGDHNGHALNNSQVQTTTARQRRNEKAHNTHWLAAGSKDGKISLWDIF